MPLLEPERAITLDGSRSAYEAAIASDWIRPWRIAFCTAAWLTPRCWAHIFGCLSARQSGV